jgi:photosystem II stability/assembly factor-like uncharacterized protein
VADRLLASTRKGLFTIDRQAGGWVVSRVSFLAENVSLALADPRDGGWYVALNHGHFGVKLKFSPDAGETWEERAVPAYPEGAVIATADGKPPAPATLKQIWALETGGPDQPGRLWAGTAPGGLFRSEDGGKTWDLVRGLWDHPARMKWFGGGTDFPALHSICRDPRDSKKLSIAVSCGGVWKTTDDGATWHSTTSGIFAEYMPPELKDDPDVQDVHMMTQCREKPEALWAQHHNGIFRTVNGGQKWEHLANAKPSGFGFGVAVHPSEPDTAWFVPAVKDERRIPVDAKLVVTRTRDGGQSFESLANGLPKQPAYDVVFRHALTVDETGNRVAFGSTTGGLWVSEDQGDHWLEVPARLPPVYAVRFVN